MRENQTAIYYLTGDDAKRLAASPQLEGFRARGVEVLLLADPVDAFWVSTAAGFDGKPFKSVSQGAADIKSIALIEGRPWRNGTLRSPPRHQSISSCLRTTGLQVFGGHAAAAARGALWPRPRARG